MAFWSAAYAALPYPQTIVYLVVLPALFFTVRGERKARRDEPFAADLLAAGILFVLACLLYFEQAPLQA